MSKTWMITGVSSGFGYELTRQLLDKGDKVIGTVRNKAKISDLITEYPTLFDCQILDVTDAPAIHEVVKDSFEKHGEIDVIINNAGYGIFGAAEELSDEQVDLIIATNLTGSIQLQFDDIEVSCVADSILLETNSKSSLTNNLIARSS
ncbi:SDR family NAD(P)-dependent oxidoreductase [uncultured Trichococcus sp.]|uniref:SDR family NAD(P)-dependent oxidoreductase n=1 Tax=uncultured Trichococcus sp. TaxID=189665 RepID=UPI0029C7C5FB|nr:SDR family NAD(P)-dependent oxidoreductase [uncultured Trichococcus sp.]